MAHGTCVSLRSGSGMQSQGRKRCALHTQNGPLNTRCPRQRRYARLTNEVQRRSRQFDVDAFS